MVVKVGINGFGRVGRVVFRTCLNHPDVKIAAINDPAIDVDYICYLMKYDSTHGRLKYNITRDGNTILIGDCQIQVFLEKAPQNVPWQTADVQYVIEASGMFTNMEKASGHLIHRGVKRVIVTAPSVDVPMLILGVNDNDINADMKIVSCGSSTLYCLAPIAKVLEDRFGIDEGFITSIHAMTPSLKPLDGLCLKGKHWRDHRSITQNIIPATIGACKALGRVLPGLQDKMCGLAFRVPITNVSVLDFTVRLQSPTSLQNIAACVEEFSRVTKQSIMKVNTDDVVSSDFIGDCYSCILDVGSSMQLRSDSFKLVCWYENEYSYACRVIDLILFSEAQFKEQLDFPNHLGITGNNVRGTTSQKVRRSCSPIAKYTNFTTMPTALTLQPPKTLINRLDRSSPINNARNRSASRTMGPCKIWNEDINSVRRQNTVQMTPRAAVRPSANVSHPLSRSNSPDTLLMRQDLPRPIVTTTCNRAQERLEIVKKEFSKMVDMTESLLKKSFASVNGEPSETKKENNDKKETRSSTISTEIEVIDIHNNDTNYSVDEQVITITVPVDKSNIVGVGTSKNDIGCAEIAAVQEGTEHCTSECTALDTTCKTIVSSDSVRPSVIVVKPEEVSKAQNKQQERTKSEKTPLTPTNYSSQVFRCYGFQPPQPFMANNSWHSEKENKSESFSNNYDELIFGHRTDPDSGEKVINFLHTDESYDYDKTTDSDLQNQDNQSIETEQTFYTQVNGCKQNDKGEIDGDAQNVGSYITVSELITDGKTDQGPVSEGDQQCNNDINDDVNKHLMQKKESDIEINESEDIIDFGVSGSSSPKSRKLDIYDKLDSDSNSSSSNSFRTEKKRSQVIAITDLTSSLDDLESLDKICRIIEISDELSDVLFSTLSEKAGDDELQQPKWSFKELCEKVNLDEFCNKVFGK